MEFEIVKCVNGYIVSLDRQTYVYGSIHELRYGLGELIEESLRGENE